MTEVKNSPLEGDSRLAARLGSEIEGDVWFDAFSRGRYSTDASAYQIEPIGVVVPRTWQDVISAIQIAADEKIAEEEQDEEAGDRRGGGRGWGFNNFKTNEVLRKRFAILGSVAHPLTWFFESICSVFLFHLAHLSPLRKRFQQASSAPYSESLACCRCRWSYFGTSCI